MYCAACAFQVAQSSPRQHLQQTFTNLALPPFLNRERPHCWLLRQVLGLPILLLLCEKKSCCNSFPSWERNWKERRRLVSNAASANASSVLCKEGLGGELCNCQISLPKVKCVHAKCTSVKYACLHNIYTDGKARRKNTVYLQMEIKCSLNEWLAMKHSSTEEQSLVNEGRLHKYEVWLKLLQYKMFNDLASCFDVVIQESLIR